MNFFISDLHMGHTNIIKYCDRPFKDVNHMNWTITENWNKVVAPEDVVYCLGDFSFGQYHKYTKHLNGEIILILGNHDKEKQSHGHFKEIHNFLQIEINGIKVNLKHYPYRPDVGKHDIKFFDRMLEDKGEWLLHGHIHNSGPRFKNKSINCSVELWDYTPIAEAEIVKHMQTYPDGFKDDKNK